MTDIRNRVTEMRVIRAEELQDNEGNWRFHPQFQRDSLRGILETVGIGDALKAYDSERQGGLTLIDGHLRKEDYPNAGWPVLILDVNDDEADILLATLDPLAAMAEADVAAIDALTADVKTDDTISAMLAAIQSEAALEAGFFDEIGGISQALSPNVSRLGKNILVKVAVYVTNLSVIERAISSVGVANRGEALTVICSWYLETHGTAA